MSDRVQKLLNEIDRLKEANAKLKFKASGGAVAHPLERPAEVPDTAPLKQRS